MDRDPRDYLEQIPPPLREEAATPSRPSAATTGGSVSWTDTPFRNVAPVGQGGMGAVLRAEDMRTGRLVALKLLVRPTPQKKARLQREGQLAAQLNHPNVVRVHEIYALTDETQVLVTEFVPNARHLDKAWADLGLKQRIEGLLGVASGVAAAHAQGITHRDLKPENVLVDQEGHVRVADFGIAFDEDLDRLTLTGAAVGTPSFMAPEQLNAKTPSPATDVWALGTLLYLALTDMLPFQSENLAALAVAIDGGFQSSHHHTLRGCPPALIRLVRQCLRSSPAERPQDAAQVASALKAWLKDPDAPRDPRVYLVAVLPAALLAVVCGVWLLGSAAAPNNVEPAARAPAPAPPASVSPRDAGLQQGLRMLGEGAVVQGIARLKGLRPPPTAEELAGLRNDLVAQAHSALASTDPLGAQEHSALASTDRLDEFHPALETLARLAELLPPAERGRREARLVTEIVEGILQQEAFGSAAFERLTLLRQAGSRVQDVQQSLRLASLFFEQGTFGVLEPAEQQRWFVLMIRLDAPTPFLSGGQFRDTFGPLGLPTGSAPWEEVMRLRVQPRTLEVGQSLRRALANPAQDLGPRQWAEACTRSASPLSDSRGEHLELALLRDPDCVSALTDLAEVRARQGAHPEARRLAVRCLTLMREQGYPSITATRTSYGRRLHALARVLIEVGDWDAAQDLVTEGVTLPSSVRTALLNDYPRLTR